MSNHAGTSPSKHNSRRRDGGRTVNNGELSLEEVYDIWDHASLLFHSYEWDSAAHNFAQLAAQTTTPAMKAILLTNVGIIRCHMGEYAMALDAFVKALVVEHNFAVGHFLAGIASYELSMYEISTAAFNACAVALAATGGSIDYHPMYLNFELEGHTAASNATYVALESNSLSPSTQAQQSNRCLLSRLPAGLIFESPGQGEVIWDSPVTEQCIQPSSLASTASFSRRGDPPKDHPLPHISFDEVFVTDGANAQGNRVTTISTLCAAQATATHREEHKLVHNAPIHGSESAADSFAASQFAHSEPLSHSISVKAQRKNMPYFQGKGNKARRLEEKTATRPSQDIHDDYKSRLQRTLRLPRDARIAPEHLRSLVWFSKNTGTDEANSPGIPGSSRVLSTTQSNVAGYIGGKPSLDGPKSTSRRHSSSESMKPQVTFTEPQNHGTSHEEIRALRRIQAKAKLMGYNKGSLSMNESSESEVPHVHREEAATSSLISLADTMEATVQPNSPATREQPGWRPASSVYSRPVDGDSQSIRSQTYGKLDIILDDERESTATYGHLPLLLPRTYKYPDTNTRDSVDSEESQDTIEDERSLDKPPQAPIAPETDLEKQSVISPGAYGDMISTPVNDSPVQETLDPVKELFKRMRTPGSTDASIFNGLMTPNRRSLAFNISLKLLEGKNIDSASIAARRMPRPQPVITERNTAETVAPRRVEKDLPALPPGHTVEQQPITDGEKDRARKDARAQLLAQPLKAIERKGKFLPVRTKTDREKQRPKGYNHPDLAELDIDATRQVLRHDSHRLAKKVVASPMAPRAPLASPATPQTMESNLVFGLGGSDKVRW